MQATSSPHNPVILYLPFYRRLLIRTGIVWLVPRLILESWAQLLTGQPLLPVAAAGLVAFVLALDLLNARAMRESVFRQNAGVATQSVLLAAGGALVVLELVMRTLIAAGLLDPVFELLRMLLR